MIVSVTFIGTVLTILATIWGFSKIFQESKQSVISPTTKEIIAKSPIELTEWFRSVQSEPEARKQAKVLYAGKMLRVLGKPDFFAVGKSYALFMLPGVYARIENSQLPYTGLPSTTSSMFLCTIETIGKDAVHLNNCVIEE